MSHGCIEPDVEDIADRGLGDRQGDEPKVSRVNREPKARRFDRSLVISLTRPLRVRVLFGSPARLALLASAARTLSGFQPVDLSEELSGPN